MSLIAAVARNDVIGRDGRLPWRLPADMRRFRELTTGHHVIMGRRTYESIGKPLPERTNVVLSRTARDLPGCTVVSDLEDALSVSRRAAESEAFVIGGAQVYAEALPRADRIYLTRVDAEVAGDTYFPKIDPGHWQEVSDESHPADEKHAYSFRFLVLERRETRH